MASVLLQPFRLGGLVLPNRIVLSPMTRGRIHASGVPDALTREYYRQRASAGLLVSEGTCPSTDGQGIPGVPRIYTDEHVAGWSHVMEDVHAGGGRMFMQLWHCGRVSLDEWQPRGGPPIGPSAVIASGARCRTGTGEPCSPHIPRAATLDDLKRLTDDFARAAANARAAGCEGVEIHACNGYLVHQFFSGRANRRGDRYGGSVANRIRFAVEIAEAVAAEIGAERTGIRISPLSTHQDAAIDDPHDIAQALIGELNRIGLVYLHCVQGDTDLQGQRSTDGSRVDFRELRQRFAGAWIANNGLDPARGEHLIAAGDADLVSFGRMYIANPDLVERVRTGAALNRLNQQTVYRGPDPRIGYLDYPLLAS